MNELRHERRVIRGQAFEAAWTWAARQARGDFREATDVQVVVEQLDDGWSATIAGTFEVDA